MKLNKLLIIFIITLQGCVLSKKNTPFVHPVTWSISLVKLNDSIGQIEIKAIIENGWHLYSQFIDNEYGPLPTIFSIDSSQHFQLIGSVMEPKPIKHYDSNFDMNLEYFEKEVVFIQNIQPKTSSFQITGNINFMVCNDETCLPPKDEAFEIDFK